MMDDPVDVVSCDLCVWGEVESKLASKFSANCLRGEESLRDDSLCHLPSPDDLRH